MVGEHLICFCHFIISYLFIFFSYFLKIFLVKYYCNNERFNVKDNAFIFIFFKNLLHAFFIYQIFFFISLKISYTYIHYFFFRNFIFIFFYIFLVLYMLLFLGRSVLSSTDIELLYTIFFLFFIVFSSFFFVVDLITFFLNLELTHVIFYLFFLMRLDVKSITIIKYKNLLSNYLWGTFFSTIFFLYSIILFVYMCGSLDFFQIVLFNNTNKVLVWQIFFISFLWKIGSSSFYFLKLEIYQLLPLVGIFFFSIISVLFYSFILYYFFSVFWFFYYSENYLLMGFVFVGNLFILLRSMYLTNFYQFLGYSAINLWFFILLLNIC